MLVNICKLTTAYISCELPVDIKIYILHFICQIPSFQHSIIPIPRNPHGHSLVQGMSGHGKARVCFITAGTSAVLGPVTCVKAVQALFVCSTVRRSHGWI